MLYDAVAVVLSEEGAKLLSKEATAKDFVSDAFAHAKFIGHTAAAKPLLEKAGIASPDGGVIALKAEADAAAFLKTCGQLRFWKREPEVHAV